MGDHNSAAPPGGSGGSGFNIESSDQSKADSGNIPQPPMPPLVVLLAHGIDGTGHHRSRAVHLTDIRQTPRNRAERRVLASLKRRKARS
jgi:hypothetical protein